MAYVREVPNRFFSIPYLYIHQLVLNGIKNTFEFVLNFAGYINNHMITRRGENLRVPCNISFNLKASDALPSEINNAKTDIFLKTCFIHLMNYSGYFNIMRKVISPYSHKFIYLCRLTESLRTGY